MKNNIRYYLILSCCAVLLFILTSFLGALSHTVKYILGNILYAIVIYWVITTKKEQYGAFIPLIIFAFPILAVHGIFWAMGKDASLGIPSSISILCGILVGYWMACAKGVFKVIILIGCIAVCWMSAEPVYVRWHQKMSFGNYTGQVSEALPAFQFTSADNIVVNNDSIAGKIVVFDFWQSACGVCFIKFPLVEQLSIKYKDRKDVVVYTVSIPLKGEDLNSVKRRLPAYSFPQLLAGDMTVASIFKLRSYPTSLIIVDKKIVFRGSIELLKKELDVLAAKAR